MDPFWGLKDGTMYTRYRSYEDILGSSICVDTCQNTTPKMGPFWGSRDGTQDPGSRILQMGRNGVGPGDHGVEDGGGSRVFSMYLHSCNTYRYISMICTPDDTYPDPYG